MVAEPEPAQRPLGCAFDELLAFFEQLRPELEIGIDQVLAVQRLLAMLAQRDQLPDSAAALAPFVGPIVCRSAEDQRLFARRFAEFASSFDRRVQVAPVSRPPASPALPQRTRMLRAYVRRRWLWYAGGGLLILALTVALGRVLVQPAQPVEPSVQTAAAAKPALPPPVEPLPAPAALPRLELRRELVVARAVPVSPERATEAMFVLAPLLLLLLLLLRRAHAWFEARRFLARDAGALPSGFEQVKLGVDVALLRDPAARALANVLRERELLSAHDLDVRATVASSARRGGTLSPSFRPRRRLPDYVALIERSSAHDVQAAYFDHWLDQLSALDVGITRYGFDGEPRQLTPRDGKGARLALGRVAAAARDHRALIFSDGAAFFSPITGALRPGVDELQGFSERVLCTPQPRELWGERERTLAERGLAVLQADAVGLAASRGLPLPPGPHVQESARLRPLPRFVDEHARLWLHPDPPSAREIAELLSHLRAYLGPDGYDWLAACALYPQLRFELTAALGAQLRGHDGKPVLTRSGLLALGRLPFMRAAFMPDWLRGALLASLPRPRLEQVRRALRTVLVSTLAPGATPLLLELARKDESALAELFRAMVQRVRKQAPARDPAHDRVFLRFMDKGYGLRMPAGWFRALRSERAERRAARAAEPPPLVPPVAASLASAALSGGVFSLPLFAADGRASALDLLGMYVCATVLATSIVVVRWARPEYLRLPRLLHRLSADPACAFAVTAVAASLTTDADGVRFSTGALGALHDVIVQIPLLGSWPSTTWLGGLLFVVGGTAPALYVSGAIAADWNARRAGRPRPPRPVLLALARFADRYLPDRLLFTREPAPAELPATPPLHGALAALLIGPMTAGLGAPLYALIVPFMRVHHPRGPARARAVVELVLCWAGIALAADTAWPTWLAVFGPIFCAFTLLGAIGMVAKQAADTKREDRPLPTPAVLWAAGVFDRIAPDRWLRLQPRIVPLLLLPVLCTIALATFRPHPLVAAFTASVVQATPGWPKRDEIRDARVLRPRMLTSGEGLQVAHWNEHATGIGAATDQGGAVIWKPDGTEQPLRRHASSRLRGGIELSPQGGRVLTTGGDDVLRLYSDDGTPAGEWRLDQRLSLARFSPDGERIAAGGDRGKVYLFLEYDQSAPQRTLSQRIDTTVTDLRFSPDGALVAAGFLNAAVQIWRQDGNETVQWLRGHTDMIMMLKFSADGTRLLSGSLDGTARIWRVGENTAPIVLRGHDAAVYAVAFSPYGRRVATGSRDGTVRIWLADGSGAPIILRGHEGPVWDVSFSADGAYLLTASDDGTARLWSTRDGHAIVLAGHEGAVRSAELSPDGRQVLTASMDGTARIWTPFRRPPELARKAAEAPPPTATPSAPPGSPPSAEASAGATAPAAAPTATRAEAKPAAPSLLERAQRCGDDRACVIKALDGRAKSEAERERLIDALVANGDPRAVSQMKAYLTRYPNGTRSTSFSQTVARVEQVQRELLDPYEEPGTAEPASPAQSQPSAAMEQATACLLRGDNPCVIRALNGKAKTTYEYELLIETYRALGERAPAFKLMKTYVRRFPDSRRAEAYRAELERDALKSE